MRIRKRQSVTEERAYLVDLVEEAAGKRLPESVRWMLKRVLSPRALVELREWVTGVRSRDAALLSALLDDQVVSASPAPTREPGGTELEDGSDPGYEPPPVVVDLHPRCPEPVCGGDLGGGELGRLETHVAGCPRFPL